MTKLRIKNLKQVQTSIRKEIIKALRDKKIAGRVALIAVNDIRNTSLGDAADFTKEMRDYYKPVNKTNPKYKRNDIRITFTGELLNDLIKNVKLESSKSKLAYVIEHSDGLHDQYRQPKKKKDRKFKKKTHKETRFDKKSGEFKQVNRATKIPYKFISTQLIKRLGYDYLKFGKDTEAKILKFIKSEIFKRLK